MLIVFFVHYLELPALGKHVNREWTSTVTASVSCYTVYLEQEKKNTCHVSISLLEEFQTTADELYQCLTSAEVWEFFCDMKV